MIPGHWFWLDKAIIREFQARIGPSAFSVYCFLASYVDKNQMCFPSQGHIANALGCSRSTVSRAVEQLEAAKLIRRRVGAGGRTEYHLSAIPPSEAVDNANCGCTSATGMSQECTEDAAQAGTIDNQRERENTKDLVSFSSLAEELAETLRNPAGLPIYEAYCRKYPEEVLRRVLAEVMEAPEWRIVKSRAHYFTYLLKKHV